MYRYKTILKEAEAEQTIEKSRFIANLKPVETKAAAESFIADIRGNNKTATHNVPAIVLGDKFQTQWASDDGEPSGTAGAPIVQMLVNEGITNIAVVVTRYFGGIKLGTGGLVRAYTGTAKLGLSAAGVCDVKDMSLLTLKFDYSYLKKIQSISQSEDFDIQDISYSDSVTATIAAEPENICHVKSLLADVTVGTYHLISEAVTLTRTKK